MEKQVFHKKEVNSEQWLVNSRTGVPPVSSELGVQRQKAEGPERSRRADCRLGATDYGQRVTSDQRLFTDRGFTLLEALLSITILAISATALSYAFTVGFRANEDKVKNLEKSSYARGMMEIINAVDFSMATSGSDTVTVQGQSVTRTWSVTPIDMNGDSVNEPDAMKVTVTVDDVTLESIIIDSKGLVTMKR